MILKVSVKIVGAEDLHKALAALGDATAGSKLSAAVGSGALVIVNRWKELTPYRTGTYRRSIHQEPIEVTPTKAEHQIGTDITDPPYPVFLEYGTSRMPARPSARPAWDEKIGEAQKEMEAALKALLEAAE